MPMIQIPGWGNTKKAHYSPSLELTFLVARVFDTPLGVHVLDIGQKSPVRAGMSAMPSISSALYPAPDVAGIPGKRRN